MVEETREPGETVAQTAATPKAGKKFPILIVAIAGGLLLLGAASGGAWWWMHRSGAKAPPAAAKAEGGEAAKPTAETEGAETPGEAGLVGLEPFIVNLNDPKGERYMKVTLRLTVTPAEIVEKISKDEIFMARARDRILTVLSAKTVQDVGSPIGKETLRREILARVSPLVAGGKLEDVLFSDFVVQ